MLRIAFSVIAAIAVGQEAAAQVAGAGNCPSDIHQTLYGGSEAVLGGAVEPERAFIFARQVGDACQRDRGAISLTMNMFSAVSRKVVDPTHKTEALTFAFRSGSLAKTLGPMPELTLAKQDGTPATWGAPLEQSAWGNITSSMLVHHLATGAFAELYNFETTAQAGCGLYPVAEAEMYSNGLLPLVPGVSTADEMQPAGLRLQWMAENCDGTDRLIAGFAAKLFVNMAKSQISYGDGDPNDTLDFAAKYLSTHLGDRQESEIWPKGAAADLMNRPDNSLGLFK